MPAVVVARQRPGGDGNPFVGRVGGALFLGLLSVITRSGLVGLSAGIVGMAGLMLYCRDYAGLGFLLGALTLARAQSNQYRAQHRTGQQQA